LISFVNDLVEDSIADATLKSNFIRKVAKWLLNSDNQLLNKIEVLDFVSRILNKTI